MKKSTLKVGDLVYLKDVGFPYNQTDRCGETWEGASCIVIGLNSGFNQDMIDVEPIFPIGDMNSCLFWAESIKKEDRPWLKNNLKIILKYKKKLMNLADEIRMEIK